MKRVLKLFLISLVSVLAVSAWADDTDDAINSLGGNRDLIKRAKSMDADNDVQVVQNRTVDRNLRFELGVNYGLVAGGDPYLNTQDLGGSLDFHIDPHWSIGARYSSYFNSLTSEGNRVYGSAQQNQANDSSYQIPAVDYIKSSTLGVVSFYPFYGKMNLFDMSVVQFDVYVLGGYGQVSLANGTSPSFTTGGGIGLWLSQHISSRIELRYQNYHDTIYTGSRNIDAFIITAGIGFLL
jgi:outer membrane beta-barrel protein